MELTKRSGLRVGVGLALLVAISPMLTACDEPASAIAAQPVAAPEVSFVTVKPQPFAIMRELPGRIAPTRVAAATSSANPSGLRVCTPVTLQPHAVRRQ